ncbi:hypothetical protein [Mycobacterium tuberculosis]|uniref:hypothetical protein n=1 Tax=Ralstonia sp. CP TaxID=3231757 RepID=UPI0012453733
MNTKHTPGPWIFYADTPSTDPNWHIVTTANRMVVLANVHIEPGNETALANARLIAAAPELLVALEKLTNNAEQSAFEDWLQEKTPSGDAESVHRQWKESSAFRDYFDQWRHALDAIAKATGA